MCHFHNTIGSLTFVKNQLKNNNINDFNSLKEVMDFQSTFENIKSKILAEFQDLVSAEKTKLAAEIKKLDNSIAIEKEAAKNKLDLKIAQLKQRATKLENISPKNILKKYFNEILCWCTNKRIQQKERSQEVAIQKAVMSLNKIQVKNNKRYEYLIWEYDAAVEDKAKDALFELNRKKTVVDELNSFIIGAVGENKVVKEVAVLSNQYHLINDFNLSFLPAIYRKQENDYIKSVQIDHILIGPSGIFLIETKNWSEQSVQNLDLWSPVNQVKRAGFALYTVFEAESKRNGLSLHKHHWGNKKVTIKNLLVLINNKPKQEFQHVKLLKLSELLGYINHFQPIFSTEETENIVNFLLAKNNKEIERPRKSKKTSFKKINALRKYFMAINAVFVFSISLH